MSTEGILARGKANYDSKRFMDNPETLAYIETLTKVKPKPKKEVKKNASKRR